jgi:phage virion morphogenesis protein
MTAVIVEFEAKDVVKVLLGAKLTERDLHLVATSLSQTLLNRNTQRHDAYQNPDGSKWTPLKAKTLARKAKTGRTKWLVEQGDMLRFYGRADGSTVEVGTADYKAFWHHAGTSRGLPARTLVGFPASDEKLAVEVIEDHLQIILQRRLG